MYKVLIVDDEPFVREGLKLIIDWQQYGFVVCEEASNGEEALKLITELSPELVITDIKMPEMDGLELIKQSRSILNLNTHFIILSGYNDFEYAQKAIKYNVVNYLLKPVDEDQLIEILKKISKEIRIRDLKDKFSKTNINNIIKAVLEDKIGSYTFDYIKEFFSNIDNTPKRYVQVEINVSEWFESFEQDELRSNLEKVTETINKTISKENINCLYEDELGKYGIILSASILKYFNNSIEIFVNTLLNDITNNLKFSCQIIVGKEILGLQDLKDSYRSCIEAKYFNLYNNNIIYYDNNKEIEFDYSFNYDASVEKLIATIEDGKEDGIIDAVNGILIDINNKQIAPEIISSYFIILISKVIKHVYKKYGDIDEFMSNYTNSNGLQGNSVYEIREKLVRFSIDISKYIRSVRNSKRNTLMYEIEQYINNNYKYDITLKKLSNIFFINPVYLGKLLRKHLGMYFNDYLESVRIEEAKKLLRRTNLKLSEIANKVGYADANYFINKFEKVTQVTPTQYKNSEHYTS